MRKQIIGTLLLILIGITASFGQSSQQTENKADQTLRSSGRINPASLGMEFDLPFFSYPGRGLNLPIGLSYSSKVWRMEVSEMPPNPCPTPCGPLAHPLYAELSAAGWTTSLQQPYVEYTGKDNYFNSDGTPFNFDYAGNGGNVYWIKRISVHLWDGSSHELRASDSAVESPNEPSWDGWYYAVDGSGIRYYHDTASSSYKILLTDGSFYTLAAAETAIPNGGVTKTVRKALSRQDRNGNQITYVAPSTSHPNGAWQDTLGRIIDIPVGLSAPATPNVQNYVLPGMTSAAPLTYKLHWKKLKDSTAATSALSNFNVALKYVGQWYFLNNNYQVHPSAERLFSSGSAGPNNYIQVGFDGNEALFNPVVLAAIELPNGQKYEFGYNVYGEIDFIKYPTGAGENFVYEQIEPLGYMDNVIKQTNRGVTSRKVYETAGNPTPTAEWSYSAYAQDNTGNGQLYYRITTVAPNHTKTERIMHRSSRAAPPWGFDDLLGGMPIEERFFSANDTLLRRKITSWTTSGNRHPRETAEESIVYDTSGNGSGLSTKTTYEYDGDLNQIDAPLNVKRMTQYAFLAVSDGAIAPGSAPVSSPTAGMTLTAASVNEIDYLNTSTDPNLGTLRAACGNQNLLGLPIASRIKEGAAVITQSKIVYDETNYSAAGRCQPTSSKVWDSTKGAATNDNAYLTTRVKYDVYGNVVEKTDAKGNTSTVVYDATYHAYPVKRLSPVPDPTGVNGASTAMETETTYNLITGLPISSKDINGQTTSIEYNDALLRPTKITAPNGQETITEYGSAINAATRYTKVKTRIDATNWAESYTWFDGLLRIYKSEQVDSHGNVFVEKEFDAEGRVKRVSNPFRSSETKQWTTNVYDEASRIKEIILPDGAKIKTDYGVSTSGVLGVTKIITDQAGKKRKGISDALGRMIRVIEDPDGQNLPTDYVFDVLGNLRETIQGEQSRYFSYDSLSRLLRAKQPEQEYNAALALPAPDSVTNHNQWSAAYSYDDNGNIVSMTDARNITVTASYDKLNRLTFRNYSDSTPDVGFYYDGKGLDVVPNYAKGQPTKISSSVSETRYVSFDLMGRLLTRQQLTTAAQRSAAEAPYSSTYTYNLSGALISETYPSGRVVTNNYNPDGELESVWAAKPNQTSAKLYLSDITRNSAGAVERLRLGNGRWETTEYNERLQITKIGLGYSATDKSLLNLEYEYGTNLQNNGALRRQKISYTGLSGEIIQDYTYDDLNRLQSATETMAGSQTPTWKQVFSFDRYGNRVFDANNTTTLSQVAPAKVTNPVINTADNRLKKDQDNDNVSDYEYDKNGSLVLDAENKRFVYDAESRQTQFFAAANQSQTPDAVYQYDGEGKRVRKISGQTEVIFVYNAKGQLIAEYSNQLPTAPKLNYLTNDHLGSPRINTDEAGTVVSRHDYTAFGEEIMAGTANRTTAQGYNSADEIRQAYTGYERDDESGLDFAQARYYHSKHGRFTSVDPLTASANIKNPQTFNRYTYVLNSPYKFTDPLGLLPKSMTKGGADSGPYSTGEGFSNYDAGGLEDSAPNTTETEQISAPSSISMTVGDTTYSGSLVSGSLTKNDGNVRLNLEYDWKTGEEGNNSRSNAYVSEEVKNILNDAVSRIATNSINAQIASHNVTLVGKVTLNLEGSADLGVKAKKLASEKGSISGGVSIELNNPEEIANRAKAANDEIQVQLVSDLKEKKMKTAWSNGKEVRLGGETVKGGLTLPAKFGQLAREAGNQAARELYNETFKNERMPAWRNF